MMVFGRNFQKILGRGLLAAAGLGVLALLGGAAFLAVPAPLLPEADAALRSTAQVTYSDAAGWLTFTPAGTVPTTGLIFYPGGRVPAAGYAPAASALAGQGFLVVIVPMPFNLAALNVDGAAAVQAAHPEIQH